MSTKRVGRRKSASERSGIAQHLGDQVRTLARLEPGGDRAALVEPGEHGAREQLDPHDDHDGRHRPPLAVRREPEEHRNGGEHRHGEQAEPGRLPARDERQHEQERDATPEGPPGALAGHRPVDESLEAHRAEDGDRDHRQVAHASRVVEVDVAERHLEQERLEPPGGDDRRSA